MAGSRCIIESKNCTGRVDGCCFDCGCAPSCLQCLNWSHRFCPTHEIYWFEDKKELDVDNISIDNSPWKCDCGNPLKTQAFNVYDCNGLYPIELEYCCMKSVVLLGFWPFTPSRPQSVFTVKLMSAFEEFLYEGMNAHSFVSTLSYCQSPLTHKKVYRSLLNCYLVMYWDLIFWKALIALDVLRIWKAL